MSINRTTQKGLGDRGLQVTVGLQVGQEWWKEYRRCSKWWKLVKELQYKDLLMSTFTQGDHDRDIKTWG
jgi:hypothetical protein